MGSDHDDIHEFLMCFRSAKSLFFNFLPLLLVLAILGLLKQVPFLMGLSSLMIFFVLDLLFVPDSITYLPRAQSIFLKTISKVLNQYN